LAKAPDTHSDAPSRRPCTLRLDEYDIATREFFSDAVEAVASASDPILGQIHREKVEVLPTSLNTVDSGEIVRHEPILASASMTFSVPDGIEGEFSDVHLAISETAEQFVAAIMPNLFGHVSAITEATGNVVSGAGRPLWEAMLEVLQTIEISFNEDGEPSLPSIVMHPDTAAKIGDPPEGYQEKADAIIARRRDEWLARRRTRRLPRLGR
jgi:hypothetical protein